MATNIEIKLGRTNVVLTRSDTLVGLRPRAGRTASFENEVRSFETRGHGALRGKVAGVDVVEIPSSAGRARSAREDLGRMMSADRQTTIYHTSDDGVPFVPTGTIYLSFAEGSDQATVNAILERYSLSIRREERDGCFTVSSEADTVEVCQRLLAEPTVAIAEPDLATPKRSAQVVPDKLFTQLWHLQNAGGNGAIAGADARVAEAWKRLGTFGSADVIIGMIDDGFDLAHPDLRNKAVSPWDFVRNCSDVSPDNPRGAVDDWHGTACAGVAAANLDAGDVIGAAPNARIMPIRMSPDIEPEPMARMFYYLAEKGAWLVNCSWGPEAAKYPLPSRVEHAITYCAVHGRKGLGMPVLFAAGNFNASVNDGYSLNGFAVHPLVTAVAASNSFDQRSPYSNFGAEIWICAPSDGGPGRLIVTSDVTGTFIHANGVTTRRGYADGDYYEYFKGTSSACALASGVCALILSAAPRLPAADLRTILKETARRIGKPGDYGADGHSDLFGFGCIDAAAAVQAALDYVLVAGAGGAHHA